MFNLQKLLDPISEDAPCGEDLAFSSELDAIARAREADDPSLQQGAWVTTLKEADWKFVASGCAQLIGARSKDLRLAVWLAEASAKTDGFRGLGEGLLLIAALCERYWDYVFPLPDEDGHEQRIGNLCWIAARVPQLIMETPLTQGVGTAFSMMDFEVARSRAEGDPNGVMEAARRQASREFYEALVADTSYCLAAIAELERVVDARLGADGPGFSLARSALANVVHFVMPAARDAGAVLDAELPAATAAVVTSVEHIAAPQGPMQTRAQALAQLRQIAEFFRRTEPHSPVAYLADKAADWGDQPLHVWLRGVVKDPASFAHLEELLGLERGPND